MGKVGNLIVSMQKVSRTEDGKPTEFVKTISIREQKQEIRMILKEDPFQEFIEADFQALPEPEESEELDDVSNR